MADRSHSRNLIAAALSAVLAVSACGETSSSGSGASTTAPAARSSGSTQAEEDLAKQARAMQKTILQGALAGGGAGGAVGFAIGGRRTAGTGFSVGLGAGALAGTYVAFVQRKYARKESRLRQIKSDLDRNAAEMQTTINVMNQVLAAQKAELAALRAQAAAGAADQATLQRELSEASGNLSQMQIAIDGATKRQNEFSQARGLTLAGDATVSPIDGDLASLSNQIAQMKTIASDLATSI